MNPSTDKFIFGCCSCNVSVNCLFLLVEYGRIKCPNCRFIINKESQGLGAFLLDTLYEPVRCLGKAIADTSDCTVFHNGKL